MSGPEFKLRSLLKDLCYLIGFHRIKIQEGGNGNDELNTNEKL
jgi:hypothetical protein